MLLLLLIYGYATGTHSSRKIERATDDSLAFRFIDCDQHPDHDTLANFRRRFGEQFADAFVQVLRAARENHLSRFGTVSLDGTKIHANANRHSALCYGHAEKIEARLKGEVQEMLKLTEAADPRPRARCLRAPETDPGAGVRHHQVGDGLPPVPAAGVGNVRNEWTLVCLAWNLKRMAALRPQGGKRTTGLRFRTKTAD